MVAHLSAPLNHLGYTLLRSKSGLAAVLGCVLLVLYAATENNALPLLQLLGPQLYSLFGFVASSSVLILWPIAYWLARRPLRLSRELELDERLPYQIGALGIVPVVAFVASGGCAIPVAALNYSLLVCGVYMVAEAAVTLLFPRRVLLRRALVTLAVAASLLVIALPFGRVLLNTYSAGATRLAGIAATDPENPGAFPNVIEAGQAAASESDPLSLLNLGSAQYYDAQARMSQFYTGQYKKVD